MAEENTRNLQIVKIYMKDCSVESPNSPAIFSETGETQFKLDIDVKNRAIEGDNYEVVLSVSARAAFNDRTLFLVEVHQAGLFSVSGFSEQEREQIFGIWAPTQLFPFVREVASTLCSQAGFPQVMLPIINFEQFHEARRQNAANEAAQAEAAPPQGATN
ncbi:MAG: protein-export chaperone SecB [Gammaproteobacteria bacterium]